MFLKKRDGDLGLFFNFSIITVSYSSPLPLSLLTDQTQLVPSLLYSNSYLVYSIKFLFIQKCIYVQNWPTYVKSNLPEYFLLHIEITTFGKQVEAPPLYLGLVWYIGLPIYLAYTDADTDISVSANWISVSAYQYRYRLLARYYRYLLNIR